MQLVNTLVHPRVPHTSVSSGHTHGIALWSSKIPKAFSIRNTITCTQCVEVNTKLTVSHLAIILSFSNLANSRLSWMVVRSFHRRSIAIPISTMAAMTPRIIPSKNTFGGHSRFSCARTCQ